MVEKRQFGPASVYPVALGAMNICHGYQPHLSEEEGGALLQAALDLGYDMIDTATLYGGGLNEQIIGRFLSHRRDDFVLASKCGLFLDTNHKPQIKGTPETIKAHCDASLQRLKTDMIDLYYLHRLDKTVPIEDSAGAFADLIQAGKIRSYGLSEVSAATIQRAHAVHPVGAVQNEYSLWTRNPELGSLQICSDLGIAFVAFSPVARGFLTGKVRSESDLLPDDLRRTMPRFDTVNLPHNLSLLDAFESLAQKYGVSPAILCLDWVKSQGDHIISIPGTTNLIHLEENFKANALDLPSMIHQEVHALINHQTVRGPRYNKDAQATIDTEEFDAISVTV